MIPDAGTQQQEEQQGLAQCYEEWINDPVAQREYQLWQHRAWLADYAKHEPEPERNQNMVAFSSMATSKFLKKEDFEQDALLTIKGFERTNVAQEGEDPEYKFVVKFEELDKGMVLNSTNRHILEKTFGPDTEDAIGRRIVVYVDDNISFGGKLVGGLRMRAPKKPAPQKPRTQVDPEDDGEVPF